MRRFFLAAAVVCFAVPTASAQTKFSATVECGAKPAEQHVIAVGDRPDHSLGVEQLKCTWTKPIEIGGDKSKDGVSTATEDISGNHVRTHGMHVATMESGEKYFVWYGGAGTTKDGSLVEEKGRWGFTGGTGKLKGIKGTGTYSCAPSGDSVTCDIEGEYELPKM
jgi:hypothetical protein